MRCKLVVINCALYKLLRYASIFEDENLKAEIIVCPVVTYFYFISTNHFFFHSSSHYMDRAHRSQKER